MLDVFSRLRVVSLADVYVHEGVVERWVERIADFVQHDGTMKNPIVVAEAEVDGSHNYVVLDGMHRVQALQSLGAPDILVYVSDYWSEDVRLESWDAVLLDRVDLDAVFAAVAGEQIEVVPVSGEAEARARVYGRELAMALVARDGPTLGLRVRPSDEPAIEIIVRSLRAVEDALDLAGVRAVYTPSSRSLADFATQPSESLFLRPRFSKQEVLERTLAGRLFPRKSTRFLVPERPLRVDFHLTVLKAALSLEAKNQLLADHLNWCWENNRVRYYPEPVYVFGD
jgi:ParB-like chromosome segregation protein Spo0J